MIRTDKRFKLFTHQEGSRCWIPGTNVEVSAFADRIEIGNFRLKLPFCPFSSQFTLEQDLENYKVCVFGHDFKVEIRSQEKGISVGFGHDLHWILGDFGHFHPQSRERLFLGVSRSQDLSLISRRNDPKEILPILYFLSQSVSPTAKPLRFSFFRNFLSRKSKISNLFSLDFLKLVLENPKAILSCAREDLPQMFQNIREFFIQESHLGISVLPNNPFPEGSLVGIKCEKVDLDLQWSKRSLSKITVYPKCSGEIFLRFPENVKSFRVKYQLHDRGFLHMTHQPLSIVYGQKIFLDRFYI